MNRLISRVRSCKAPRRRALFASHSAQLCGSVTLTRLFLSLSVTADWCGELHVAHMLWGGYCLFIAPAADASRTDGSIPRRCWPGRVACLSMSGQVITKRMILLSCAAPSSTLFFAHGAALLRFAARLGDARSELYRVFDGLQEVWIGFGCPGAR